MARIKICLLPLNVSCNGIFEIRHRNLPYTHIIIWSPPFGTDKIFSYSPITFEQCPKFKVCQYEKSKCKYIHGNKTQIDITHELSIHDNHLCPGSGVSVDHFEYLLKFCTYTSFVSITSESFVVGCIFVDHMVGNIHVEYQLVFSSSENIQAKQNYEKCACIM